jgi:hypothetical protein
MTHRRSLATLALIALVGAGCGSNAPSEKTSADDTGTARADTGTTAKATPRDGALKFASCMRDNGVGEFPDPDASGELTIDGILNGSSLDPDGPAWKQAIAACRDLQPPGFTGAKRSTGQQEAALQFAQCIRENGVKDFPDPAEGEPLVDTNRIPSAATSDGMSALNAAMQTCGDLVADLVRGR